MQTEEIWKDIPKYEGCYQVSNLGRIRRLDTLIPFKGTLGLRKGRILKPTLNSKGYLTIILCWKSLRKTFTVHQLVALSFLENPLNLPQVNHKNGFKLDNHVANLEWISARDNQLHAYATGLKKNGELSGNAVLNNSQVVVIKRLLLEERTGSDHQTYQQIASLFGVSHTSIKWIDKGRTWRSITVEE